MFKGQNMGHGFGFEGGCRYDESTIFAASCCPGVPQLLFVFLLGFSAFYFVLPFFFYYLSDLRFFNGSANRTGSQM